MPQSLTNLLVHLVFSTKDRQPFLNDIGLRSELHRYLGGIVNEKGGQTLMVGGVSDHLHLLVVLSKTVSVADLVRELKRTSTLWLKKYSPQMGDFSWQGGYGAFSVGQTEKEIVRAYIQQQEAHHRTRTFQEEYRSFLDKYGITYDERYVWE